jgi:hypothetical protein
MDWLARVTPFGRVLIVATLVFGVAAAFSHSSVVAIGLMVVVVIWIIVLLSRVPFLRLRSGASPEREAEKRWHRD